MIEQFFFRPLRGFFHFGFLTHFRPPLRGLGLAILFFTAVANAQTNTLTDAEIQGRALAQKILAQQPSENFTNTGTLYFRSAKGKSSQLLIKFTTTVTDTNWQTEDEADYNNAAEAISYTNVITIIHQANQPNIYFNRIGKAVLSVTNSEYVPFFRLGVGHSDFCGYDLGLEFFHWPAQKVLKKETHRLQACTVLESINPNPAPESYSRVVSWIDNDSLGIVEAIAYDFNGKKLKDFYPKNVEKVNGQWQVQTLVMENVQTGSKSRIEFDLRK